MSQSVKLAKWLCSSGLTASHKWPPGDQLGITNADDAGNSTRSWAGTDALSAAERMSTEKKDSSVRIHIRVLYLLITVLCFGFAYATWICLTEIRQLRSDLDGEITALRRGDVIEFSDDDAWSNGGTGTATSEADLTPGGFTIERMDASSDEVVRVRRDTKRRRSRPSFFTDGNEPSEGSGGSEGDWVWLTSYSRIPVSDTATGQVPRG